MARACVRVCRACRATAPPPVEYGGISVPGYLSGTLGLWQGREALCGGIRWAAHGGRLTYDTRYVVSLTSCGEPRSGVACWANATLHAAPHDESRGTAHAAGAEEP